MMEILSQLRSSHCRHCGLEIVQLQGDLSREPYWRHVPAEGKGTFEEYCPGQTVAEPAP